MANDDGQTYFYEEHHSLFLKISNIIKYYHTLTDHPKTNSNACVMQKRSVTTT